MNVIAKKILFYCLFLACVAVTTFLFLPDTCPVRLGIMSIIGSASEQSVTMPETKTPNAAEGTQDAGVDIVFSSDWNTFHGDNAMCGVADGTISDSPVVLWSVMAGAPVRQPLVVHKGIIVAVNAISEVLALKSDGTILWRHALKAPEPGSENKREVRIEAPILAVAGRVFVGADLGDVVALDIATGEERWWTSIGGAVRGTPNYSDDGRHVFVIDQDEGALVCLDADTGATVWRYTGPDRSDASPAVSGNVAVFGSCASALHVVSLDSGKHLHDIAIEDGGGQIAGGAAVADGHAYAGVRDGRVVCADIETGKFIWTTTVSELEVFCTPAVNAAWVIVTSYDGKVHGLNRETGEIRWQRELGGIPSSAVIVDDKIVVTTDGTLYLLNLETGEPVWEQHIADEITSPAVLEGMILVGSEDGMITALGATPAR
jgi:outer membrane protein assembly factor BamB